jgi:3D (Asp-Asp-Asp) domain-containing protein
MSKKQKILILSLISGILLVGVLLFRVGPGRAETNLIPDQLTIALENGKLAICDENALLPTTNPANPDGKVVQKLNIVATAYSSTVGQTDSTPFLTAAGTKVRDGIIANNYLPFGTEIRIPEIYGDKVFVVEDRMSWKKGNYQIDIWFSSYSEAKTFGAKRTYIEILES